MRRRQPAEPPHLAPLDVRNGRGDLIGRVWQEATPDLVTYFAVHRCGRRSPNYGSEPLARRWLDEQEAKHVRV